MQIMSKLLEEVLSKKNMILVYKSTSSVDNVANDEIKDKLKQGLTNHNLLKVLKFQSLVMVLENLGQSWWSKTNIIRY